MLSKIEQRIDDINIVSGNPNLRVAQTLSNRLGIYYQSGVFRNNIDFALNNTWDPIFSDATYDGSKKVFLNQATNGKYDRQYQISWQASLNNLWKFLSLQSTVYYDWFRSNTGQNSYKLNSLYWSASVMMSYKGWTFGYTYAKPQWVLHNNIKSTGENFSRIALLYKYQDWNFYASCYFPFTKYGAEYYSEYLSSTNPGSNKVYILDNRNMITMGVSWHINFGELLRTLNRSLQNQDRNQSVITVGK